MTLYLYGKMFICIVEEADFFCDFEDLDCPLRNSEKEGSAVKFERWERTMARDVSLPHTDNTLNLGESPDTATSCSTQLLHPQLC